MNKLLQQYLENEENVFIITVNLIIYQGKLSYIDKQLNFTLKNALQYENSYPKTISSFILLKADEIAAVFPALNSNNDVKNLINYINLLKIQPSKFMQAT